MTLSHRGINRILSATIAVGVIVAGGVTIAIPMLSGCTSSSPFGKKGVAATFDGGDVTENEVNDYIVDYRKAHGLEESDSWKSYLKQSGSTVESIRKAAISTIESRDIVESEAKKHNIKVSDADVDGKIKELRGYYSYNDDEWQEQLKSLGYTSDGYRAYIKDSLLREKLMQQVIKNVNVKDSDVIYLANEYTKSIDGARKISVMAFDDKGDAERCVSEMDSGKSFDDEKKANGGDNNYDGWDCIVSEDDAVKNAVKDMKKGDVSGIIDGNSMSFIVRVDEEVNVPDGGFKDKSQMTDELYDEFKSSVESNERYSQFNDYLDDLISNANININDMPDNVPYKD